MAVLSLTAWVFTKNIHDKNNSSTITNIDLFNFELKIHQILFWFLFLPSV